jgi:3-methyl-2-oxobutanoate hydroxymethyltransferase
VLVINDLLGLDMEFKPKFVKRYATLGETVNAAVRGYVTEVREGAFPAEEHSFHSQTLRLVQPVPPEGAEREDLAVQGAPV